MSARIEELTRLARAALIIAAQRRTILTYKELGAAIGLSGVELSHVMRRVLARLSDECIADGMPSLPALVVNARSGKPGPGWQDGHVAWFTEAQQVFRMWGDPDRLGSPAAGRSPRSS